MRIKIGNVPPGYEMHPIWEARLRKLFLELITRKGNEADVRDFPDMVMEKTGADHIEFVYLWNKMQDEGLVSVRVPMVIRW